MVMKVCILHFFYEPSVPFLEECEEFLQRYFSFTGSFILLFVTPF